MTVTVALRALVLTLATAALLAAGTAPAGADAPQPTPTQLPGTAAPQIRPPDNLDDLLGQIAVAVPGFGGMFYDQRGDLNVYLMDPAQGALAETVITSRFDAERLPRGAVRVLAGRYAFSDLQDWRERVSPLMAIPGVVFLDIDEAQNRLRIGTEDQSVVDLVRQELDRLGIPQAAVAVEQTEPVVPLLTLRNSVRPLVGGLQVAFSGHLCTLGFNAVRQGVEGFVVASHCSETQGGVEGTVYYQPTQSGGSSRIGVEAVDPDYFTGEPCPAERRCRYSDSLFATRDSGVEADLGFLAQTAAGGSLDITGDYRIVGSVDWPVAGETLNKVGRTTGWTQGVVTATCADVNVDGTDITQLCQYAVEAGSGPGDSASPVFRILGPSNDAYLYGLLWGADGGEFFFSPMGGILRNDELGALSVTAPPAVVGGLAEYSGEKANDLDDARSRPDAFALVGIVLVLAAAVRHVARRNPRRRGGL